MPLLPLRLMLEVGRSSELEVSEEYFYSCAMLGGMPFLVGAAPFMGVLFPFWGTR